MTVLIVDLSDPNAGEACADCKVGESKTFTTVTGTLVSKDDKTATFEVTDLEYADSEYAEGSPEEEASETPEVEAQEKASGVE